MVVRMARGFASLEFPSTYTMLRDSLKALGVNGVLELLMNMFLMVC